jgi:hypothetical protein
MIHGFVYLRRKSCLFLLLGFAIKVYLVSG